MGNDMNNTNRFACLAAVIAAVSLPLFAREVADPLPVRLKWERVEGAWGYQVEVKSDTNEPILNDTFRSPQLVTRLPEGKYLVRISVLNKFRRAEDRTEWQPLTLRRPYVEPPLFVRLMPGLASFRRGDALEGALWTGAFASTAFFTANEYRSAAGIIRDMNSDPLTGLFNNPALIALRTSGGTDNSLSDVALLMALENPARQRALYARAKQRYNMGAGLTLLILGLNFFMQTDFFAGDKPLAEAPAFSPSVFAFSEPAPGHGEPRSRFDARFGFNFKFSF